MSKQSESTYLSRREHDKIVEQNIAKIMDELYKSAGLNAERVTDTYLQRRGVDLYIDYDGKKCLVDEKSASSYFMKRLNTFAFELSASNNTHANGWFDEDNEFMQTEYYVLIYPYAPNRDKMDLLNTVDEIEALLIKKSTVWDYLKSVGIRDVKSAINLLKTNGKPIDKNNRVVSKFDTANINKYVYDYTKNIRIVQSAYLYENPINIVLSRNVLRKMAEKVIYKRFV